MKEMMQKLRDASLKAIQESTDPETLENLRVRYLGKKGELTGILRQMGKRSGAYSFHVLSVDDTDVRFYPLSVLNGFRRQLADMLDARMAEIMAASRTAYKPTGAPVPPQKRKAADGVLMRSRYCIRYELGLCPKLGKRADKRLAGGTAKEPLFLVNNGRRLQLAFDCKACEMTVLACD